MSILSINIDKIYGILVSAADVAALIRRNGTRCRTACCQDGSGNRKRLLGLGRTCPNQITSAELETIRQRLRGQSLASLADVIVVIGIGGSYLGAKAVLEAHERSVPAAAQEAG